MPTTLMKRIINRSMEFGFSNWPTLIDYSEIVETGCYPVLKLDMSCHILYR
uniref:Uncharacterized protein n=1 Tax=Rhizophora mucronata TaxID=61149 RepID=A0A2P2QKU9_RHIMU